MDEHFFFEDYAEVSLYKKQWYICFSDDFYKTWFKVLELYNCAKICNPEPILLTGCDDDEINKKMMNKFSLYINKVFEKDGFLYFTVSKSGLQEIYGSIGLNKVAKEVDIKFAKLRGSGWQSNVFEFNNFIKKSNKEKKVAFKTFEKLRRYFDE